MKSNAEQLGTKLKNIRKAHQLTSKQTAELLEITANHWGLIERNKTLPSLELLIVFCQKFQVPLDFLLTGKPLIPDDFVIPEDAKQFYLRYSRISYSQ